MKKIPIDTADFEMIQKNNLIYVDKTYFLYKIVSEYTYYFLSRPRRFGKSLFISTLENFYKGKSELFKNLYIYNKNWDWEEYPIIKLDFNEIECKTTEIMEKEISELLNNYAEQYDVELNSSRVSSRFNELVRKISEKFNKGVVVLIDEYDKPIISHLGKNIGHRENNERLKIVRSNQEFLKNFYDNLKPLEPFLQTVFITGISKFSKVSIFSTLNNLIEIDKEPVYAEILGFTEKELHNYFSHYFDKLAEEYDISLEKAKQKVKETYDGFRFTEKDVKLYNPYSSGRALHYSRLDNYWFESGTPTFLVDLIKERDFNVTDLERVEIGRDEIKTYDIEKMQLIPLLFQTGYLTIKNIEDEIIYTLGYPNYEVEIGFTLNLIKSFSDEKIKTPVIHKIKKSLINKKFNEFMEYIRSLFASIANINIPVNLQKREYYYHSLFYLTGVLFSDNNLEVYSELLTSEGRIDMMIETEKNVFIIEFKCDQDAKQAIEQIRKNNYPQKFTMKDKKIFLIGINFNTEKRNVAGFEIVEN